MVVIHTTASFGLNTGTVAGPSGPKGTRIPVTKFTVWVDKEYIYAIQLYWKNATAIYGDNSRGSAETIELEKCDYVNGIYCDVDPNGGFRGFAVDSHVKGGIWSGGYLADGTSTALIGAHNKWTDIQVWTGIQQSKKVIVGIKFYYTTPSVWPDPAILALPALGAMAHTAVVTASFFKVGALRYKLDVKAPSCEPPPGTDPAKVQLWHRTFRAQENCKEMALVYFPSILIASVLGYEAFGRWVPRAVGVLSLGGAFFRYKYLNAYIQDADTRGPPFRMALHCMRPVLFLAVASSAYLIGKEIYYGIHRLLAPTKIGNEE